MRFSVQNDLDRLSRRLTNIQREQVPFATSMALNETATDVSRAITVQMDRYLDSPTTFTKQAYLSKKGTFRGKRSTKRKLYVDIIPGPKQAAYLKFQINGGTRTPFQKTIFVPTRVAPKNKHGNIARGLRKKMILGEKNFFSAGDREGKTPGIYYKQGERIIPMAFYVDSADYKPIFPVNKIVEGVVKNRFKVRFDQAIRRALATAR